MESSQYKISKELLIPYYEDTQKRTFLEKLRKIRNTLLQLAAYSCPINRLRIILHRRRGVHTGSHVYIGMFCYLDNLYPHYIYIEDNVSINAGTMILTHFNPMRQYACILTARVAPVLIKKKSIVAVRSTILPGVEIGENAVVSAGSVVEKRVKPYTIVKGVPAKKVAEFEDLLKK